MHIMCPNSLSPEIGRRVGLTPVPTNLPVNSAWLENGYKRKCNKLTGVSTTPLKSLLSARAAVRTRQYQAAATRFKPPPGLARTTASPGRDKNSHCLLK